MEYAAVAEALKGSPALRRDEIRKCSAAVRIAPQQRATMAKLMNVPPGRDPAVVACQRMIGAVASGRFSWNDYEQAEAGQITPKTIRILQAR